MLTPALLALTAILTLCTANPNPRDGRAMAVHESVVAIPSGFAHGGSVPSTTEITLRIALTQSDIAGLQAKTYAVSDPSNAIYGQYLTPDEVANYIKPTTETLSAVFQWLSENNINATSVSSAGDVLQISLPISKADKLLAAQFTSFTHMQSGKTSINTLSYSVPASLQPHINYVHPTVAFVPPLRNAPRVTAVKHKRKSTIQGRASDAVPAGCASQVNPSCIQSMYGFPGAKANNSHSNVLGIAGYSNEYANSADLQLFLRTFQPDSVGTNFTVVEIDGGQNDQALANSGIEAVLDVEMAVGLAKGVPVTFISVGSDNEDGVDGFIDIVNSIMAMPAATRPTVLTTSYGFNEPDLPVSLAYAMCNSYMQLGAAGISVIFASGDGGVGGIQSTECTSFVPTAPGACPFNGLPPQSAASLSGGGFSNYFVTPGYQWDDVTAYIASIGDEYSGLYYSNGRGFPDIALQAENLWLVNGTSCASPIFASMIALINDRLIAAGRPVLGFLNPFLYSTAGRAAFTDIASGTNPGCNTNGFSARPGWDPVTGLGTPNVNLLLSALGL
ncbi:family S53 protease [Mycena alexandri]|uniref:Family S53 protease n=1 Tax=Mycena alexandri TaxID=1745969 RepID=A0AAD6SXA1_9AGAR|nr:family S53 protease [Mycena alexandri]